MTIDHYEPDGTKFRVNPKTGLTVERKLPSGRWEIVSTHATRDDARARLFALVGVPDRKTNSAPQL